MSQWFKRVGGSSLCRGKNEPVPERFPPPSIKSRQNLYRFHCPMSCNRSQRREGDRHNFPGKTMSQWFKRVGGSSLCRGKNEPVPERFPPPSIKSRQNLYRFHCPMSCNRSQRREGDRHNFPGKTMSQWFKRVGGSSLFRGKNEPVPGLGSTSVRPLADS